MMEYRIINQENSQDINIKNEPFPIYGKMIPSYENEKWGYSISLYPENEIDEMVFPDENYDFEKMQKNHIFIGAYDKDQCVGLAILADDWFKYMCLDDLKVSKAYRGRGVGRGLVQKAMEVARKRNYNGIYAIGQDNNLDACKFYVRMGFEIGGFDNRIYRGTIQENKANILFYLE